MAYNIIHIERNEQKMNGKMLAVIACDSKSDVSDGMTFYDGVTLEQGSIAYTNDFNYAEYGGDNKWHWKR